MSNLNNTMNTTENRNYVAEFYKNPEHNYGDFFGAYVADDMREIERRITMDESRIRSVRENYDEIAGK